MGTKVRDLAETAATLVGDYYLPGSSALTSNLASKGSQAQLGSGLGQLAQAGTSLYGGLTSATQAPAPVSEGNVVPVGGAGGGVATDATGSTIGPAQGSELAAGQQASGAFTSPITSSGSPSLIGTATGGGDFISPTTGSALPAPGTTTLPTPSPTTVPTGGTTKIAETLPTSGGTSGFGTPSPIGMTSVSGGAPGGTTDLTTSGGTAAAGGATAPSSPGVIQSALDKALKYGPLGLTAASLISGRSAQNKFADQLAGVGAPQTAAATTMLQNAVAGKVNPADAYNIDQWKQQALAQTKQYYASAGLSNSSMETNAINQVNAQADAMVQQSVQTMLTTAMNELNITDQNQVAAIQAEMQANTAAGTQGAAFLNALGTYMTGPTAKPAAAAPAAPAAT